MTHLCIHGHFYQPPRENPWLEAIEGQESAEPFHDWNARIAAECYAPNGRCRILDEHGRIVRIVNNYSRISFNFGPTLLSWMETHDSAAYATVLEADRLGAARFGGHGPALAQVYNHAIMPLCNARDRRTQVRWGLADFQFRFGRAPEGMWLAECAADTPSLEELADAGIKFTILSPYQAARVRPVGSKLWTDVCGGAIDPTTPYIAHLPSGKSIALFFYDGPVSQAIAFEKLLQSGDKLAGRLLGTSNKGLMHVATDGETYGHHVPFGDMALAYALDKIEAGGQATLTVYGEYLAVNPPQYEVEIIEGSSWSCAHGVERWRADCGCRIGGQPGWTQAWRGPLRVALDRLRDRLIPLFERRGKDLFVDPWAARDDYIRVVLDRRPEATNAFLLRHARRTLSSQDVVVALQLMELQRNALLMYTSCGWFFDELSGIETVQVMAYAGRAAQLAEALGEAGVEDGFLDDLAEAKSNHRALGDGRAIYDRQVRPLKVDLAKVTAHFALSALFEDDPRRTPVFCYSVTTDELQMVTGPTARLVHGVARVHCNLTRAVADFDFAAVHLGELNLCGGVRPAGDRERLAGLVRAFARDDISEVLRRLDADFDAGRYSLGAVFKDERKKLLAQMLKSTDAALEAAFRAVVEAHSPTMMVVQALDTPLLPAFRNAARFLLQLDLKRALESDVADLVALARLLEDARNWGLAPDAATLNFAARGAVVREVARLRQQPDDAGWLRRVLRLLELIEQLGLRPDLWQAQNEFYELCRGRNPSPYATVAEKLRVATSS